MTTTVTPQQKKILDKLASLTKPINSMDLAELLDIDYRSCNTQFGRLAKEELITKVDDGWQITALGRDTKARSHLRTPRKPYVGVGLVNQIISQLVEATDVAEITVRLEWKK